MQNRSWNTIYFFNKFTIPWLAIIISIINIVKVGQLILKKMGIVLKRAQYFITCEGKMMENTPIDSAFIRNRLAGIEQKENFEIQNPGGYYQMNLFTDFGGTQQV